MNKFEKWLLKKICNRAVAQNYHHSENIAELYSLVYEAAKYEFSEDTVPTLNSYLTILFKKSLDDSAIKL